MNALILKDDGLLYACRLPEEPKAEDFKPFSGDGTATSLYEAAKEKAIKEAVLCADQEQAKDLILGNSPLDFKGCKKDTPYIIPGLYFGVRKNFVEPNVAILILPKQEEPSKPAFTDEDFREVLRHLHAIIKYADSGLGGNQIFLHEQIAEAQKLLESENYFNFNQSDLV